MPLKLSFNRAVLQLIPDGQPELGARPSARAKATKGESARLSAAVYMSRTGEQAPGVVLGAALPRRGGNGLLCCRSARLLCVWCVMLPATARLLRYRN